MDANTTFAGGRWLEGAPLGGVIKRCTDVVLASMALVLFAPLIAACALAIRLQDGGPAFFGHARIGHRGRTFRCLKLRSMVVDGATVLERHLAQDPAARAEWEETRKLKVDPRVTPLGDLLRRTSLDELPQLWNVVRGEMSIVGPRPVTESELARYGDGVGSYYAARPGLTGLWQISGRNDVSYAQRVAFDSQYVEHWSSLNDLKIIFLTIPAVVAARGTY